MSQTKFESLLREHQQAVYRLAYYMLGDAEEARDIAQEAFVRAWKSIRSIRESTARSWLLKTAQNLCIDRLRRQKFCGDWPDGESHLLIADLRSPLETCLRREICELVQEAISHLPPNLRAPLILRDLEGLSYDEVAKMLGEPLGTVKSNIFRGRRLLKKRLAPLLSEVEST